MAHAPTLAIRSQRVVTPEGIRSATLLIDEGKILEVADYATVTEAVPLQDWGDAVIMPGLVDLHVHVNEPGRTEWEGFWTATRAAAAGGVTTIVDMPLNSSPVTTTIEAFQQKVAAAQGQLWVDCGFHGGLVPENATDLKGLLDAGVLGLKAFLVHSGIDDFPAAGEKELRAVMPLLAERGIPLLVHAELEGPDGGLTPGVPVRAYREYLASRPPTWETRAIELTLNLCEEYGCPIHIVHLATASALPRLKAAREAGLPVTVETSPHYLYFAAEEIEDGATSFKCAPPIREAANREQLWGGLLTGEIDLVASDHSPCPPNLKKLETGNFAAAWGGIASLQLELPAVWTAGNARGASLEDVSKWMSRHPAEVLGLETSKGSIAAGFDADLVVFDPDAEFSVEGAELEHRHPVTPYEGRNLRGAVLATYGHGEIIYHDGQFAPEPKGRTLLRKQTS